MKFLRKPTFVYPAIAAIVIALAFVGYYTYWVHSQEQKLDALAFRELSSLADRIADRIELYHEVLIESLNSNSQDQEDTLGKFFRNQADELELCNPVEKQPGVSDFVVGDIMHIVPSGSWVKHGCVKLSRFLAPILQGFRRDLFDDILVTNDQGLTLYQTARSGIRIRDLAAVLPPTGRSSGGPSKEGSAKPAGLHVTGATVSEEEHPFTEASRYSSLSMMPVGGATYRIYLTPAVETAAYSQPAEDKEGKPKTPPRTERPSLVIAGITLNESFRTRAFHLPEDPAIWFLLLLALFISVSWPLLRFAYMTPAERVPRRFGLNIILNHLTTALLLTLCFVHFVDPYSASRETDQRLDDLANRIASNIDKEVQDALEELASLSKILASPDCDYSGKKGAKCGDALANHSPQTALFPWFDHVEWDDQDGTQIRKIGVQPERTPQVPVGKMKSFNEALSGHFWSSTLHHVGFRLDPLYSPTTGRYIAVVTRAPTEEERRSKAAVVSISIPMISLQDPVFSPGFGFAIIDEEGQALFHSESSRNQHENFFDAIEDSDRLRAAVDGRISYKATLPYRGASSRIYVTPVSVWERCPWTIVVFRDLTPVRARHIETMLLTLALGGTYWLEIALLLLLWGFFLPPYPAPWVWPTENHRGDYLALALAFFLMYCGWVILALQANGPGLLLALYFLPLSGFVLAWIKLGKPRFQKFWYLAVAVWSVVLITVADWLFIGRSLLVILAPFLMLLTPLAALAIGDAKQIGRKQNVQKQNGQFIPRLSINSVYCFAGTALVFVAALGPCLVAYRVCYDFEQYGFARLRPWVFLRVWNENWNNSGGSIAIFSFHLFPISGPWPNSSL